MHQSCFVQFSSWQEPERNINWIKHQILTTYVWSQYTKAQALTCANGVTIISSPWLKETKTVVLILDVGSQHSWVSVLGIWRFVITRFILVSLIYSITVTCLRHTLATSSDPVSQQFVQQFQNISSFWEEHWGDFLLDMSVHIGQISKWHFQHLTKRQDTVTHARCLFTCCPLSIPHTLVTLPLLLFIQGKVSWAHSWLSLTVCPGCQVPAHTAPGVGGGWDTCLIAPHWGLLREWREY